MATHDHTSTHSHINTYHCLCTTLILATPHDITTLPTRQESADGAIILPLSSSESDSEPTSALHNIIQERKPIIIRREDGFEKRILLKCTRCALVVGYRLDEAHFGGSKAQADGLVYFLPGALVDTDDMKVGKTPLVPGWAQKV